MENIRANHDIILFEGLSMFNNTENGKQIQFVQYDQK